MKVCYQRLKKHQLIDFINDKSDNKNVLVISGPRQVGKTTLIQEVLQTRPCLFLNLEKEPSVTAAINRCVDFKNFKDYLKNHQPKSVKICTLLDKPSRRKMKIEANYCGKKIEDHFVVGYGLDYQEICRNYPDIYQVLSI
jgi:hypothetical protein